MPAFSSAPRLLIQLLLIGLTLECPGLSARAATPLLAPRAPREAQAPTPSPPPQAALAGDWRAPLTCGGAQRSITLGIDDAGSDHLAGYVELPAATNNPNLTATRFQVSGPFDEGSGQFDLAPGPTLRDGNTNVQAYRLSGTFDRAANTISARLPNCGNTAITLAKIASPSALAARIAADLARRREWIEQAKAQPHPGRLIGAVAPAALQKPSCDALLAWAVSVPLTARVRVADVNYGQGMLRQYDDEHSAPVFGLAGYYWFETDLDTPQHRLTERVNRRELLETCRMGQDPRSRTLFAVLNDRDSIDQLVARHYADDMADESAARLATTGGTAAEDYTDLAPLTKPDQLANFVLRNMFNTSLQPAVLTPANIAEITAETTRLRSLIAARGVDEARAALASLPADPAGLNDIQPLVERFQAAFGTSGLDQVRAAADAKRDTIERAVLQTAVAAIDAAPHTAAGWHDATQAAASVRTDYPSLADRSNAALQAFAAASAPAILQDAQRNLAEAPDSDAGITTIAEQRTALAPLIALDPAAGAAYRDAADARLDAIAAPRRQTLAAGLAAIEPDPANRGKARRLATEAAAPFGDTAAGQKLRAMGETREAELDSALADRALAAVRAQPLDTLPALFRFYEETNQAQQNLSHDPAGVDALSRMTTETKRRATQAATALLPGYQAKLDAVPPSTQAAFRLALAAVVLQTASKPHPELEPFAAATKRAAWRVDAAKCRTAAQGFGIDGKLGALPTVIGNHTGTLDVLACDLNAIGVTDGVFETVNEPSGPEYGMTWFAKSANISQARTNRPDWEQPPKTPEALFDFTSPAETAPSTPNPQASSSDDHPYEVMKIVFRMLPVAPKQSALVGVEQGDGAQMKPLSIAEWRQLSGGLEGAGRQEPSAPCGLEAPTSGATFVSAAHALLACPKPN